MIWEESEQTFLLSKAVHILLQCEGLQVDKIDRSFTVQALLLYFQSVTHVLFGPTGSVFLFQLFLSKNKI